MSQGMARQLGPALLGVQIEGIWHTGQSSYSEAFRDVNHSQGPRAPLAIVFNQITRLIKMCQLLAPVTGGMMVRGLTHHLSFRARHACMCELSRGVATGACWFHEGVVVYGKEHFFGGGVVSVPHEEFLASYHMQPTQMLDMGETEIPEEIFDDWLREISPRYTVATYDCELYSIADIADHAALHPGQVMSTC